MKRPVEVKTLVTAFSQLTPDQIESLSTVTWSTRSSKSAPSVWGLVCAKLKQKDNEKNRKWLAQLWKANIWSIVDDVRRYEHSMIGMKRHHFSPLLYFTSTMMKPTDGQIVQTHQADVVDIPTSKTIDEEVFLYCTLIIGAKENNCSNALEDMLDVVEIYSGCASTTSAGV